jgi:hypothetical protein
MPRATIILCLATGAKISRHQQWIAIPITDATIARVKAIAKYDNQPLIQDGGLLVEWQRDMEIDDDAYDFALDESDDPFDPLDYPAIDAAKLADLLADAPCLFHMAHAPVPLAWPKERLRTNTKAASIMTLSTTTIMFSTTTKSLMKTKTKITFSTKTKNLMETTTSSTTPKSKMLMLLPKTKSSTKMKFSPTQRVEQSNERLEKITRTRPATPMNTKKTTKERRHMI